MKEKILLFLGLIGAIFFYGFRKGTQKQKDKIATETMQNLWKNNKIKKEINNDINNMPSVTKSKLLFNKKNSRK